MSTINRSGWSAANLPVTALARLLAGLGPCERPGTNHTAAISEGTQAQRIPYRVLHVNGQ